MPGPHVEDAPENISSHFFTMRMPVKSTPRMARRTGTPTVWNVPAAIAPLKEKRETFISGIGDDDIGGNQSDEGNEQADACRHCPFQVDGDRVEKMLRVH